MKGRVGICMCCGYSHEKVDIKNDNRGNGIVATYTCPINKSVAYLTSLELKKMEGVRNEKIYQ